MESHPLVFLVFLAVLVVPDDRVAALRQMDPNLVLPACQKVDLKQTEFLSTLIPSIYQKRQEVSCGNIHKLFG